MFLSDQPTTQQASYVTDIPYGAAGTRKTLKLMRELVRRFKMDLTIRNLAGRLTSGLRQKDFNGEIRLLHAYVRDSVRYLKDIHGVETVQTPLVTLNNGFGDCDDKATLLCALLESIGHPTRFWAVGFQGMFEYQHVLLETRSGNRMSWIALETTEPVPAGWRPKKVIASMRIVN